MLVTGEARARARPASDAETLSVRVLVFASLREHLGRSDLRTEVPSTLTVASLWQHLSAGTDALPDQVLCAVNHEYVDAGYRLQDGDTVAFFPPVTGG